MSLEIAAAVAGVIASLVGAAVAALSKSRLSKLKEEERGKVESQARMRLTEIDIGFAGLGFKLSIPGNDQPHSSVSEKLLKDVEQGIVDRIAAQEHLSREQVVEQVETRMQEV